MAYIFDPLRNTFIDDEDTSLGNKLALVDNEEIDKVIKQIDDKFGPGTMTTLDQLPENKPAEVEQTEQFNRFNKLYQDGGRVNFADDPLKNFNFTKDNIPKGYVPASELAERLGITYDTLKTIKSRNSPPYQRLIEYLGEPIKVGGFRDAFGGGASYIDYFNVADLTPEAIEAYKTKQPYPDRGGAGVQVLSDENLKQKFIKAYNDGYGGRDIMSVIDPDNTLNVNQEKYGSRVLTELIKSKEITLRPEGERTKSQEAYFEKNRAPIDLEIEKINKFYKPGMTLETATKKLYPDFTPVKEGDSLSVIDKKTEQLKNTSTRLIDYKAWLKGDRPDSTILKNLNFPKNKQKIIKYIERGQDSKFKRFGGLRERAYKFYKLDKLNKKPFGYYDGLNKKLYTSLNRLGLNYQIEHGGSISQSLKKKIPWVGKFITFMKPTYNSQKIPLDMDTGILKAYDVLENKNLSIKQKKSHPDVISHNKAAKNFMQKTGIKVPIISFDKKDVNKIIEREDVDPQTKRQVKNTFDKNGWTLINPGDQIEEVVKFVKENGKDIPKNRKQIIIQGFRNTISNLFKDAPIPKGVKLPIGATAAAVDFMVFNGFLGIPAPEAALGSSQWLLKNPEAAQKIGMAINAVVDGKMTLNEFFDKNSNELGGVFKDLVGIDLPEPYSKDDEVGEERLKEMDQAMAVPKLDKTTAAPLYDFADGGRVGFSNGGAAGADDDFAAQLEYFFLNPDAELPAAKTFRETMNPVSIINDMIDPRNFPYIADRIVESGIRIGEFGARVLPALGQLAADLIQRPAFKIKPSTNQGYVQDYDEQPLPLSESRIEGTGIFTDFLNNLVGDEGTKVITEKTGLAKLIKDEEQKMKDERKTAGAKILADQFTLGMELTAPIFPGYKLLQAYAKSRKLPVDKTTRETMDKEIDELLTKQGTNRRNFLKATGAGGAVMIAKMLGVGDEFATVTKVAEKAAPVKPVVPNYFFTLADKIKKLGTDNTKGLATVDREAVYVYKDYELYEDLTTGSMRINKKSGDPDGFGYYEEEMVYTKGIGDESTQGTPPDEYEEFTVKADMDGKMKDVEVGLEDLDELIDELGAENISLKDLEAMGYEADMLPISVQKKLGLKETSPAKKMLKRQGVIENVDDDLPDLPF